MHPPGRLASPGITVASAVEVVGLTLVALSKVAGDDFAEGRAHLVGSLASGVRNAGSDVDVHVIKDDLTTRICPYLYFVSDAIVNIECCPASWAAEVRDRTLSMAVADSGLGLGRISRVTSLAGRTCHWVSRWLHAVPIDSSSASARLRLKEEPRFSTE